MSRPHISFLSGGSHPTRSGPLLPRALNGTEFSFILSPSWTASDSHLVRSTGAIVFLLGVRWLSD